MTNTPRILIAEDDETQSALLQAAMEHRGYQAVAVSNGMEALRRLREEQFDIALLDYHMPEVDGLAAAQLMQDFKGEGSHTQLIALTAAAEQLELKQEGAGSNSFDAVVSKRHGLPMLMTVIDDHLAIAARHRASSDAAAEREAAFHRAVQRRRRLAAPLAAIPALVVAGAFVVSFLHTSRSLDMLNATAKASQHVVALQRDTGSLISAVDRLQVAQQAYLASGTDQDKTRFYNEAEQLDQLMSGRASYQVNGLPGMNSTNGPQPLLDPLVHDLAASVDTRTPVTIGAADPVQPIRSWATRIVDGSESLVQNGLDAIRGNVRVALTMFGIGALYALWNAVAVFRRRWRGPQENAVSMKAASSFDMPIVRRLD